MVTVKVAVPAATCEAAWENVQTPTANEFDAAEPKALRSIHAAAFTIGFLGARTERTPPESVLISRAIRRVAKPCQHQRTVAVLLQTTLRLWQ